MTYLELTTTTAPAARSCLRAFPTLPSAHLRPSRSAAALGSLQRTEHSRIDATTSRMSSHLEAVAAFADRVEQLDGDLGRGLAR